MNDVSILNIDSLMQRFLIPWETVTPWKCYRSLTRVPLYAPGMKLFSSPFPNPASRLGNLTSDVLDLAYQTPTGWEITL